MTSEDKGNVESRWVTFGGFCFPVLDTLAYHIDGPDKSHPDYLFIEDRNKRFLMTFEEKLEKIRPVHVLQDDYAQIVWKVEDKNINLWYPVQKKRPNVTMGYFQIEFLDTKEPRHCNGELSISPPIFYRSGIREMKEIGILLSGIKVNQ